MLVWEMIGAMAGVAATALVAVYVIALAVLALHSGHRLLLLVQAGRPDRRPPPRDRTGGPGDAPVVTVQLPIYNERFVVERLLRAVAELDYPRDRLEIQVLDDSTDDTSGRASREVERMRAEGLDVAHIRRRDRSGFKAGALAHGLERASGQLVMILDADFVPQPDLLRALVPAFEDPAVAMVQARWGHRNADVGPLTRAQALILDAHFLLETGTRARRGLFFHFNGTAGIWRRTAIEDAGGWSSDTLTEDLDLSYRAQLRGWRFEFRPDVVVPADLPETLAAFRQQQARWARGTAATARKILPRILAAPLPARVRIEAAFHLTTHTVFPAMLAVPITVVPAHLAAASLGWSLLPLDLLLGVAALLPAGLFFRAAARRGGRPYRAAVDVPLLLLAGLVLAVTNTRAVWLGALKRPGVFRRTPKVPPGGRRSGTEYGVRSPPAVRWLEGSLAAYAAAAAVLSVSVGLAGAAPFLLLMMLGMGAAAARG